MPNTFGPVIDSVPIGTVVMYGGATAPIGWVLCDGTAYSRTVLYAALFAVVSTTYGIGDGSTTFNVPDARGVFIRGAGSQTINTRTKTGTRGTTQEDALQGHRHNFLVNQVTFAGTDGANLNSSSSGSVKNGTGALVVDPITDGSHGTPRIDSETYPSNITLSYIIRAY